MKTASDPRHKKRKLIVQELFANEFKPQPSSPETIKVISRSKEIDELIKKAAVQWPVEKINKIDLAILRLAVWEILEKKEPSKVVIDEAVELGKEYGGEKSPSFINAVLGSIIESNGQIE